MYTEVYVLFILDQKDRNGNQIVDRMFYCKNLGSEMNFDSFIQYLCDFISSEPLAKVYETQRISYL